MQSRKRRWVSFEGSGCCVLAFAFAFEEEEEDP